MPSAPRPRASSPGAPPLPAVLGFTGVLGIVAIVIVSISFRGDDAVSALEEPLPAESGAVASASASAGASKPVGTATAALDRKKAASAADFEAAREGGAAALRSLAARYPEDRTVLRALFLADCGPKGLHASALVDLRRLLELAPDLATDDEVEKGLVGLAFDAETMVAAMDVITHRTGSHAPDLLFEIARSGPKAAKEHASALLVEPEMQKLAGPALVVANELRVAQPCNRKAIAQRAATDGDERALLYLRPLLLTTGCGFLNRMDCFRCFSAAERAELRSVVDTIEKRTKAKAIASASASRPPKGPPSTLPPPP